MRFLLLFLLGNIAFAGKCPPLNGTFEKAQSYGSSALSIHVRKGKKGWEISRDGVHYFSADNSKHTEEDSQLGDSEISFECRNGAVVVHQNLVKLGSLLPYNKALPPGGIPGTMTFQPAGKSAVKIEVNGENPVVRMITGGKFIRRK